MLDEHVELLERTFVEQQLDALPRGQLAAGMLRLDPLLAAAEFCSGAALIEGVQYVLHGCFPLVCPDSSMAVRARETRRLTVRWRLGLLHGKPAIAKQEDRMHLATRAGIAAALLCGAAL